MIPIPPFDQNVGVIAGLPVTLSGCNTLPADPSKQALTPAPPVLVFTHGKEAALIPFSKVLHHSELGRLLGEAF
jgi:hypothetical protein